MGMKKNSKELERAWAVIEASYGLPVNGFEGCQYMGTHGGQHEFRHRSHPIYGRIVVDVPAVAS